MELPARTTAQTSRKVGRIWLNICTIVYLISVASIPLVYPLIRSRWGLFRIYDVMTVANTAVCVIGCVGLPLLYTLRRRLEQANAQAKTEAQRGK